METSVSCESVEYLIPRFQRCREESPSRDKEFYLEAREFDIATKDLIVYSRSRALAIILLLFILFYRYPTKCQRAPFPGASIGS